MSNRLAKETSPYLLQHAQNPVEWFPWSDEAFAKADAVVEGNYGAPTICHQCLESHGLVAEWDKPLWDATNQPIASRHEQQQSGTFTGFPVQLDFTASSDFFYAACCVATVYVNRGYYGGRDKPPEPTLCTGNLECDISAMWLEQEKLA